MWEEMCQSPGLGISWSSGHKPGEICLSCTLQVPKNANSVLLCCLSFQAMIFTLRTLVPYFLPECTHMACILLPGDTATLAPMAALRGIWEGS